MAKKRGPGRPKGSKVKKNKSSAPSGFWRQVFAIFLILLAILFAIGLIGAGGVLLVSIGQGLYMLFGYASFFVPFLLFILAIQIFRSEENKLPSIIWFCAALFITLWSSLFQLMASDPLSAPESNFSGAGGGNVGWFLNYWFLPSISKGVLAVIYVFFILVIAMFLFSLSPKEVFTKIDQFFRRENPNEENNKKVAEKLAFGDAKRDFTINGLKLENNQPENQPLNQPKKSSLLSHKKTAGIEKLTPNSDTKKLEEAYGDSVKTPPKARLASVQIDNSKWQCPGVNLLANTPYKPEAGNMKKNAEIIEQTLEEFKIIGSVEGANVGPRVTQYLLRPQAGVKMSRISSLDDELRRNLMVKSIRIEAPIPGQSYVGIEIPNAKPAFVGMRSILESPDWQEPMSPLPFAVGLDVSGKPIISSLSALPHLLIAGTTGSGKSVMMNVIVASLLYKHSPDDLKIIMIDPKGTEMIQYADMPHLIAPIVSGSSAEEIAKCVKTLHWAVEEMGRRYELFRNKGVRDIKDFKKKYPDEKMPYLAVFIDEWTALIDSAKPTEREYITVAVQQLAQKGRASGIDEVIMMQAPRAKYLPGSVKANIPAGFCFAVLSKLESQQIINQSGGEQLMGKGDMLMKTQEIKEPIRVQAAVVDDDEIARIIKFIKEQSGPQYDEDLLSILAQTADENSNNSADLDLTSSLNRRFNPQKDPLIRRAVEISLQEGKFSTAQLQTYLGKGHGYVSGLALWLHQNGIISSPNGNKPRELLISSIEDFDRKINGDIDIK